MKIRITLDVMLDIDDTVTRDAILTKLDQVKTKFKNINYFGTIENSSIRYHICRHDEGLPCDPEIIVL